MVLNVLSQGDTYDRVTQAILNNCSLLQIRNMIQNSVIERPPDGMRYLKNITYDHLDDIIEETGVSASYLIFGTEEKMVPEYTPYDKYVIQALNNLPANRLRLLLEFIKQLYDMKWTENASRIPALRLLAYIRSLTPPLMRTPTDLFSTEGKHFIYDDVESQYKQFLRVKRTNHLFPTDYLPDIATLAGISLHWLIGIKRNPLFCESALGDDVFDGYTFLPKREQKLFRITLAYITNDYSLILEWQKEEESL